MLTGSELLAKVKELGQAPRDQIAIACGYVRKDGKAAMAPFSEALLAAHGLSLPPASTKAKKGKPLSFTAKVAKSGTVPITAGYTKLIGAEPGDHITIEHVGDTLVLRKAAAAAAADASTERTPF